MNDLTDDGNWSPLTVVSHQKDSTLSTNKREVGLSSSGWEWMARGLLVCCLPIYRSQTERPTHLHQSQPLHCEYVWLVE